MRTVLRHLVVIIGCLHLCGGHYGILQVIAWSQMIVEYSSEEGFVQGAIQTFDGDHACDLCISISEAKKEEKEQPAQGGRHSDIELKNLLVPEITRLDPSLPLDPPILGHCGPKVLEKLMDGRPPVPPPRITFA